MVHSQRDSFGLPIVSRASNADGDAFVPAGSPVSGEGAATSEGAGSEARPTIGVYFACSNRYVRVTRNAAGDGYLARCPKCAKTMSVRVGRGGSSQRMFRVTCE